MATVRLTVPATAKHPAIVVAVDPDRIIALAPAAGGGTTVQIPTRTFTVKESLDEVLAAWLGPKNGDE